jgi:hypothetical protein
MARRRSLLLLTYGGPLEEVVPGLRSLPHDQVVIVVHEGETGNQGYRDLLSLLDRLKVHHMVLQVCPMDLIGSAMAIEECIRNHDGKEWQVRVDITGGRKLLSDAAVLAAVATGSKVCCYQVEARHLQLLPGMGVREKLPKAVAMKLRGNRWPMPLGRSTTYDGHRNLLIKMKEMDLITVLEREGEMQLVLTDRGRACREWLERMDASLNG